MWLPDPVVLGQIALRTLIIYLVVLGAIRLTGKRQIGQMTPFDLVVLLLVSNAVQNAMTGPDTTVAGGGVAAATLLAANFCVARLRFSSGRIRSIVEGSPVVLIQRGKIEEQNLKREDITHEELMTSLREHDCRSSEDVELAMLEIDGSVSVIHRSSGGLVKSRRRLLRHHARKPG